ncbi:MAG TPA: DUF4926 domain-containing protein [Thermoanaerobaculia bacterium]|nr:DUF4926 domain-containing protein [Thermoanaerobaculia bacterium]
MKLLDAVVLARDLPAQGLRAGDLGAIVEVYRPESFEVEFVTAFGQTGALVTLQAGDIRSHNAGPEGQAFQSGTQVADALSRKGSPEIPEEERR